MMNFKPGPSVVEIAKLHDSLGSWLEIAFMSIWDIQGIAGTCSELVRRLK